MYKKTKTDKSSTDLSKAAAKLKLKKSKKCPKCKGRGCSHCKGKGHH